MRNRFILLCFTLAIYVPECINQIFKVEAVHAVLLSTNYWLERLSSNLSVKMEIFFSFFIVGAQVFPTLRPGGSFLPQQQHLSDISWNGNFLCSFLGFLPNEWKKWNNQAVRILSSLWTFLLNKCYYPVCHSRYFNSLLITND